MVIEEHTQEESKDIPKLFSFEWFSACAQSYNNDPRTHKFKETSSAIYDVKNAPDGPIYFDVNEGKISCHLARKGENPEFYIEGDYEKWMRWHKGDYGSVAAVTLKIFKSKGPLSKLLRMGPWLLLWDEIGKKTPGKEWTATH
jgi:putative sterol carrier protein